MKLSIDQNLQVVHILGLKSNRRGSGLDRFYFCPFHKEKTPSFSVNLSMGVYNCFACKRGGSLHSLSLELANRTCEQLLGIDDPFTSLYYTPPREEIILPEKQEDDADLDIRGVLVPVESSPAALQFLKKRCVPLDIAQELKMTYADEVFINGTPIMNRICVPVYSASGKLINMDCRDITGVNPPKVLYPKRSVKTVFEHWKLDKEQPLFVLEGLLKMMVARSDSYFKNSSTTLGAKPSPLMLKILNTFIEVILIPDNDRAGEEMIKFYQENLDTRFSVLRIGDETLKDMDEIPAKKRISVKEFREGNGFIHQSIPMLVF